MSSGHDADGSSKAPRRTVAAVMIGIFCVAVGGLVLIAGLSSLLGVGGADHQGSAEVMGGRIAGLVMSLMAGYLILYGIKKLKK